MDTARSWIRSAAGGAFAGRNLLSVGTGQVILGFTQWGTLSILALLGGATSVGELGFALAIVTPVFQLAKLRVRDVIATDIDRNYPLGDYVGLTIWAGSVAVVVCLAISGILSGSAALVTVGAVAMSRHFETLSQVSYGHQQRLDKMAMVGASLSARGVLTVAFVLISFVITRDVAWAALSMAAANVLVYYLLDRRAIASEITPRNFPIGSRKQARLGMLALPLGAISALAALTDSIPRLLIENKFGLAELGILASFGYVVVGSSYLTRALAAASGSRVATALAGQDKAKFIDQTKRLLWISLFAGLALSVGTLLVGEPFLRLAFGPEFAEYSLEFFLMSFYALSEFLMTPLTVVLIAARRFKVQLLIQVASTVSVVISGIVLIPGMGVRGAVLSLLLAGAVRVGFTAIESYRFIKRL